MNPSPLVDRAGLAFTLYDVLGAERLLRYPRYAAHSRETFDDVIELAHRIAVEKFLPHLRKNDTEEPHRGADGKVVLIPEVKEAIRAAVDAGFMGVLADESAGGLQLPYAVALLADAMFMGANVATGGYLMLARGAANLLAAHGTPEQQRLYMDPINAGRFLGTMCLSEPQAGSSLADIKTRALPQEDGSYRIEGAKMWISGGDHELAENIVHLVLAKIPGGPPGVKGISLFIVPKYHVKPDGSLGGRNDVALAGINHKLGQRGIINTFLKFGENGTCVGHLVGQPHEGLRAMFHMMNEARIGVGTSAVMMASQGYLYALNYARERRQGRALDNKDPGSPPVRLIEHGDVRRMLLQQKAYVEGGLALELYTALLVDQAQQDPDPKRRAEGALLLDFLTPIAKAWPSDWCVKSNDLAIQVLGGYGYTREYPVEQLWRDNRLNAIHEGTNGIQAIDLLGRKALLQGGAALKLLSREISASCAEAARHESLRPLAIQLGQALELIAETTQAVAVVLAQGRVQLGLANAVHYMTLVGHSVIAWLWLRQALTATELLAKGQGQQDLCAGKLAAAQFFFRHELPAIEPAARLLQSLDSTALDIPESAF
ncbi:MAG: acyl-CoA dehydrogenase [Gammaproteobacteria bacterium]